MPGGDASGRGSELVRMFGIDAAFDGVAAKLDVALLERQFFVGCNAYLLLHDVDTCDHFCHRMFHLHASVHLDEIKLAVFIQEFECSRAAIADLAASFGTAFADLVAHFWIEQRCRRFLNDLLVTALHRTIALAQIHRIAVLVGEHLKLDMARVFQKFFHVYHGIVESGLRLGAGHGDGIQQGCLGMHHTHPRPPPPPEALMMTGYPMLRAILIICAGLSGKAPSTPGTQGTPAFFMAILALTLSPIKRMVSARGPINTKPHFSTRSEKSAFSERKP